MSVDPLATFLASASDGTAPPSGGPLSLRGVWHALRGEWQLAHDSVQEDEADPLCAWVHAALHREEGDLGNAGYWYRIARRSFGKGSSRDEYEAIARALLEG